MALCIPVWNSADSWLGFTVHPFKRVSIKL